ncbi:MAG: SPFH domain / Band 7 family protein [candidate division BRC1 bacterium ADurb.BinA364]|nr:MAG: SPFH domain / Band 7 family protein [candidate division BRC1 bacterium ADurb.BinA364]
MKKIAAAGVLIVILFLCYAAYRRCVVEVPMGFVGVRTMRLGGGIEEKDLEPGFHMVIPGIHRLQLMDARLKIMEMVGQDGGQFQIIAKDQFHVGLDVTLIYSLEDGMGHKAIGKYGPMDGFVDYMRSRAEKILPEMLGQMTTEEFYDSKRRTEVAAAALKSLNETMREAGTREFLTADHLLIRNVVYDPRFEKRLLEKQLLDQDQMLQSSLALTEKEKEKTQQIEKETIAKVIAIQEDMAQQIQILQAQTDAQIAEIDAEAQLAAETAIAEAERYKRERVAEGDLARTESKAKGDKAINAAYSGLGGQLLLVQRMVENVQFGEIEINTNRTNPFDVRQMLEMLGADVDALFDMESQPAPQRADAARQIERLRQSAEEAKPTSPLTPALTRAPREQPAPSATPAQPASEAEPAETLPAAP